MPLAEYNDVTRMSRLQLAERIRQMEITAARNSTLGAPNERHRPMEDRRRREKIARYREELDRRERFDAIERQQQTDADARAAKQSARDTRRFQEQGPTLHCSYNQANGTQCGAVAIADLETRPACAKHGAQAAADRHAAELRQAAAEQDPECRCRRAGDVEDASDCPAHGSQPAAPIAETPTPDAGEGEKMRRFDDFRTATAGWRDDQAMADHDPVGDSAAALAQRRFAAELHNPPDAPPPSPRTGPVIAPPTARPDPTPATYQDAADHGALSIECPQCHAAPQDRCYTYDRRSHCAPHRARKQAAAAHSPAAREAKHTAQAAADARRSTVAAIRTATVQEIQERPNAGSQAAVAPPPRTTTRRAPPPTPVSEELSALDRAVEELVRDHSSGAVIEAAWAAAHRLFHPGGRA